MTGSTSSTYSNPHADKKVKINFVVISGEAPIILLYERKTSFRLTAFFDLVFVSQLCDANGLTTLRPSWLKNAPMIALGLGSM